MLPWVGVNPRGNPQTLAEIKENTQPQQVVLQIIWSWLLIGQHFDKRNLALCLHEDESSFLVFKLAPVLLKIISNFSFKQRLQALVTGL